MRKVQIAALSAVAALALAGCGAAPKDSASGSGSKEADFKACMVSDAGGFNDKSFNESGYNGLKKAEAELGVKIATAESNSDADFKPNLDSLIQQKCNLIIAVGYKLAQATTEAAKANPKVHFAIVDSTFSDGKNTVEVENGKPLVFNTAEAGFLAGYAAAAMSKSGTISTYGGFSLPSVNIFMDGYVEGANQYNKDAGKSVKVLGWDPAKPESGAFAGSFDDVNKGKQITEQQVSQGSDVIMPVAGPVGQGTLAAVKGSTNLVVGVDSNWAEMYPEYKANILTSVVKEIGQSVFDTIKESKEGKFTNKSYIGTLANKGVDIAPFGDFDSKVPADVKSKLDEYRQQIADGKLVVKTDNNPK